MKEGDFVSCPSFVALGYSECLFGVVIETCIVGLEDEFTMCLVLWKDGTTGMVLEQFLVKIDKKSP